MIVMGCGSVNFINQVFMSVRLSLNAIKGINVVKQSDMKSMQMEV
jgi:hypothetical protein